MGNRLERRVATLERANRVLMGALALVAAAGLVAASRAPQNETITAGRFVLADAGGRARAELTFVDGHPAFVIRDEAGRDRLSLFHDPDATGVYVRDEEGTIRVGVAQFAHGGGGVALHGPQAKGAAVLYYKGAGSLTLYDEAGKVVARVPAESPGEPLDIQVGGTYY